MKKCIYLGIFFLLSIIVSDELLGESVHDVLFSEACEYYKSGKFSEAMEKYQLIEKSGYITGELYYNLANCYFKLGQLGKSILYYERALIYLPSDDDVKNNLQIARRSLSLCSYSVLSGIAMFLILPYKFLNVWQLGWIFIVMAWINLILGAIFILTLRKRNLWFTRIFYATTIVTFYFGICFGFCFYSIKAKNRVIVTSEEAALRSGPSKAFPRRFRVREGTWLRVFYETSGWYKVRDCQNRDGWILKKKVERV